MSRATFGRRAMRSGMLRGSRLHVQSILILTLAMLTQWMTGQASLAQSLRATERFDSGWQKTTADTVQAQPPSEGWSPAKVPGREWVNLGLTPKALWYQRSFTAPNDLGSKRVMIDLRGARYFPQVYIDGVLAGGNGDGWWPESVDVTSLVKAGQQHTLAVRCLDRWACFAPGFVYKPGMSDAEMVGKTLVPVGGYKDLVGIADQVYLRVLPASHIEQDELVIQTSTRQMSITVTGRVHHAPKAAVVRVEVLDQGKPVLQLEPAPVKDDGTFAVSAPFAAARCWSPEDPHRYELKLTLLNQNNGVDELVQRFGFKEMWTEGPDFYLNGVKRHVLGTSTWPVTDWVDPSDVRKRLQQVKACNTIAFRLHIGFWPEIWLETADELGLLIIDETAVYTDGAGMYGYRDPRFWENYRRHVRGMIRRDRNHASLAMWSLGNEVLFMGATKHDPELPKKLGELGRFAKTVDPSRPIMFEADLDPDGAYDVIGLHYPHEMPWNRDYPNTTDWLAARKNTEAGGGMLGKQQKLGFYWDRAKPLYIGEYLWVPQQDYSCSTIWFGDEAFENRDRLHDSARHKSWHDQTIAYRRAGVSGLTPWTAFGFGAVADPKSEIYLVQQDYYRPQAAYWRSRGLRYYSGSKAALVFDVFNDSPTQADFELRIEPAARAGSGTRPATIRPESTRLTLAPATHQEVTLVIDCPEVGSDESIPVESVLLADGKPVHTEQRMLKIYPRTKVEVPSGCNLVVIDRHGKWPGSVTDLAAEALAAPATTVLIVAEDTLIAGSAAQEKTVRQIRSFMHDGGRVLLLEQQTLQPLGLGLKTVQRPSTMTFPLAASHPVLAGLDRGDLSFWGGDHYVTSREIDRTAEAGLTAISVSGGADWTRYAGIAEMPVGAGHLVLVQSRAGSLRDVEPAAARVIQNSVQYLAMLPVAARVPATIADASGQIHDSLEKLGVTLDAVAAPARFLVLAGGRDSGFDTNRAAIEQTLAGGGTVYWHSPDPAAFDQLRGSLGADQLEVVEAAIGATLADREHPLLRGVSREDVVATGKVENWNRTMRHTPGTAGRFLQIREVGELEALDLSKAQLEKAKRQNAAAVLDAGGIATVAINRPAAGVYRIELTGDDAAKEAPSSIMVRVNDRDVTWIKLGSDRPSVTQVLLPAGESKISLRSLGGEHAVSLRGVSLSRAAVLPAQCQALTVPAAVVTWKVGSGRVVIDSVNWDSAWPGPADPRRFASALFANLGVAFHAPERFERAVVVPVESISIPDGENDIERSADAILFRRNASFEATVDLPEEQEVIVRLVASGTPCGGKFASVTLKVDDNEAGTLEVQHSADLAPESARMRLKEGLHTMKFTFSNYQVAYSETRTLTVNGIAVVAAK